MTAASPATSGTYDFQLTTAELVLEAFERIQMPAAALSTDHMFSFRRSLNLLLSSEWANKGPNLWAIDLFPIVLAQGLATYALPANTVCLLDVYLRTNAGQSDQNDRTLYAFSRTDYSNTPNKTAQGTPSVFYFDRQEQPNVTFWLAPDDNGPYIVNAYRMRTLQDNAVAIGEVPDIPNRFDEALCAAMAFKMAVKWKPALAPPLKSLADQALMDAMKEDRERVDMFAGPDLSRYRRF